MMRRKDDEHNEKPSLTRWSGHQPLAYDQCQECSKFHRLQYMSDTTQMLCKHCENARNLDKPVKGDLRKPLSLFDGN